MAKLDGQHALVTGGGRGIGRAAAAALSAAGAKVTVLGRQELSLKDAVARRAAIAYVVADVTGRSEIKDAATKAANANGPIDILVAAAGGVETAPFVKAGGDAFQRMFDLNVMGVIHAAQAVLGGMLERRKGRIVAVASTAGLKGYAYVSAYTAAKHAVVGLVRSLALELATTGVTVNAVCPGYTDTDLMRISIEDVSRKTGRSKEEALTAMLKGSPLGRLIAPEEVAAAVLYLCSPEAGAVNGTALPVAGGEV
jgi:3-hydroxybutyrate dehydrogenase